MILDEYIKVVRCERCVVQLGHNLQKLTKKKKKKKKTPKLSEKKKKKKKRISLIF
jgi:hypothetical protein